MSALKDQTKICTPFAPKTHTSVDPAHPAHTHTHTHTHQNAIDDASVVPGAGAFEVAAAQALEEYKHEVKGKKKLGVEAFGKALLVIPKTLAQNSGFDVLASPRMRLSYGFGRLVEPGM